MQETYMPTERLALTADGSRVVPETSPEAASLFCIPGRPIPLEDAIKYGLVETVDVVIPHEPEVKESQPAETKESKPAAKKTRKARPTGQGKTGRRK